MVSPYKENATISKSLQSYLPAAANPTQHVSALVNGIGELNRKPTLTFVGGCHRQTYALTGLQQ